MSLDYFCERNTACYLSELESSAFMRYPISELSRDRNPESWRKMKYQDNGSDSDDVAIHLIRLLERSSTRGVERATFQNLNRLRCRENPFPSSDMNWIPNLFWISSWVWRRSIQMMKHSALCCSRESSLMTTNTTSDRSIVLWVPQRPPTVRSEQQRQARRADGKILTAWSIHLMWF